MKLKDKFRAWRATLTPKQRGNIKQGIDILIGIMLIFGFVTVYNSGVHNGNVEMCKQDNLLLVEFKGVKECWTFDAYDSYMQQWEAGKTIGGEIQNGLQFNISG